MLNLPEKRVLVALAEGDGVESLVCLINTAMIASSSRENQAKEVFEALRRLIDVDYCRLSNNIKNYKFIELEKNESATLLMMCEPYCVRKEEEMYYHCSSADVSSFDPYVVLTDSGVAASIEIMENDHEVLGALAEEARNRGRPD